MPLYMDLYKKLNENLSVQNIDNHFGMGIVIIYIQGINLLFWQQGETIFLQVSISSMQTFPYIQSLVWTHGPNSAAHGPFSHGPNP